jgi:hypothetical protein
MDLPTDLIRKKIPLSPRPLISQIGVQHSNKIKSLFLRHNETRRPHKLKENLLGHYVIQFIRSLRHIKTRRPHKLEENLLGQLEIGNCLSREREAITREIGNSTSPCLPVSPSPCHLVL